MSRTSHVQSRGRLIGAMTALPILAIAMLVMGAVTVSNTPAFALTFANTQLTYQGELFTSGNPFDGNAKMKFVIYNASDGKTLWSHDGTSNSGSEPSSTVTVPVDNGLFSIVLGDYPTDSIDPESVWNAKDPVLRIWVDIAGQNEQLPDQPIRSSAVAMTSHSADVALDDFEAEGLVWSKSGGFKFPDGSLQTTAAAGADGNTLDQAYDKGGPGQGRTINADAGAVEIVGPDGLTVDGGEVQIGDPNDTQANGRLSVYGGDTDPKILLEGDTGTVLANAIDSTHDLDLVQLRCSLWFYDHNDDLFGALTTSGDLVLGLGGDTGGGIQLNGDAGQISLDSDTGTITTGILEITGGSDLAEPFAMSSEAAIPEGSVVVIDPDNPGQLALSGVAYDSRVAGVVSGAGGVRAGLTLNQEALLGGGQNVALTGRVYVKADASRQSIRPGDLLTTSPLPGHAMVASDRDRSHGAVLGKAMTSLDAGTGLVLVLVNLQ